MVVMVGLVAFAVDVGRITLTRTQLQVAADAAAMAAAANLGRSERDIFAAAQEYAAYHSAGGKHVELSPDDVEIGTWDSQRREFAPGGGVGNAVRVTARRSDRSGGKVPLFFGVVFNRMSFSSRASAVAMANPRDIAFVVDLSGSMNDDTEPCWATEAIDAEFSGEGYPTVGTDLMQDLYADLGYGPFPGRLEYVGAPVGVPVNKYAYAELTKNGGPLARGNVPDAYRIRPGDNETTRKRKAYAAIIDYQLARLMPKAAPKPDSRVSYDYWEKYLDYIIQPVSIRPPRPRRGGGGGGGPSPPSPPMGRHAPRADVHGLAAWSSGARRVAPARLCGLRSATRVAMLPGAGGSLLMPQALPGAPGQPPGNRGTLPPRQDRDRIDRFNNPNTDAFPEVRRSVPRGFRNWLGYRTYVQFMLDHGRDLQVAGAYVPLSRHSPHCPWHSESTAGGTFSFPPREQPTHAARRALIAAIQVIQERNEYVGEPRQRDWVSVVSFDSLSGGGPVIEHALSGDYHGAMEACTRLQACGDRSATTATEAGLVTAHEHIRPVDRGGEGRIAANKVVVLLTDGMPNLYVSNPVEVQEFISENPSDDYYGGGKYWFDAPLMQAASMSLEKWQVFPVGVGLGTDYDFMDRVARLGGSASADGQSPRGSGNPAEYEARLKQIFESIIANPQVRLVQ